MSSGLSSVRAALTTSVQDHDHVLQLYTQPNFLYEFVGAWVEQSLRVGGSAVLVGTRDNVRSILQRLQDDQFSTAELEAEGRLVIVDAHATIERLWLTGRPDQATFDAILRPAVDVARRAPACGRTRAWGEMVNLLWRTGREADAIHLEQVWNGFLSTAQVDLLCSYELPKGRAFDDVLREHEWLASDASPDQLDRAIEASLRDTFGNDGARSLWTLLAPQDAPKGPFVLGRIHDMMPPLAPRLLETARRNLAD
jgi:hypothetical protein